MIERRLWLAIAERFDLPEEIPDVVKEIDARILFTEKEQSMLTGPRWSWSREPLPMKLKFLSEHEARERIQSTWISLTVARVFPPRE